MQFKTFFSIGLTGFLLASAATMSVQAQTTVFTIPEGVMTFSLPATGSANLTTYLSLPLTSDPTYSGAVTAITTTGTAPDTISVTGTPWTAGSYAVAGSPYFVKFLSGAEAGRVMEVTSNQTSSLTLDTTDNGSTAQTVNLATTNFAVAVGDTFELFPGDTLASVFGVNTSGSPLILEGGARPLAADTISIYNPSLLAFSIYYFNTSTNAGYWELVGGGSTNVNNTVLYPYSPLTITRHQNEAAITFSLTGRVPEVAILTKAAGGGVSTYTSSLYPVDMPLSAFVYGSNWKTGSAGHPLSADTISLWDTSLLQFDIYYQLSDSTWRIASDSSTDQSSTVIPAGSFLNLVQRSTVSGGSYFLSSVMPYSVTK